MKRYELIIFDCDGTLVDSELVTNRVIAELINEIGITISPEECFDKFAGKTLVHITDFIKETIPTIDEVSFEKEYRLRCKKRFVEELETVDGIEELLQSLTIPFCVASNGPAEKMAATLPATGLDQYFSKSNTFSAYDIQAWKPKPDLFLHATEQMNVAPSSALVIEDTYSGVMGAVHAGIDVWAYNVHLDNRVFVNGVPNFTSMSSIMETMSKYMD